jgi:myo-inositol 2-dehydrogenase/D-chiro-inositol 1-dehydrogenase/scyllo-inositol 2-dehydrogenase (NAD+)
LDIDLILIRKKLSVKRGKMEVIRFCLIGAGRAGMVHGRNIVNSIKNAQLTCIVDSNKKALEDNGRELDVKDLYTSLDDALSRDLFDAAVVVTPTFLHRDIVVKCASEKKHVFCEKPMSIREDEALDMIDAAEKNGVSLQIGFMRRFDPPFMRAKEIIGNGDLGEVTIIKSVGRGPGLPPPWSYNVSESNGLFGEVNSHDFDSSRWLAGSEYARIYAEAENRKVPELKDQYPDFYDNAVCTIRFKNGVIGTIDGCCPVDYGYDARTEIVLTKGLISVGEIKGDAFLSCDVNGTIKENAFKSWRNRFREAYVDELKSFIESIVKDTQPRVTGYDGLAAVRAVVAANRSLVRGTPVELN